MPARKKLDSHESQNDTGFVVGQPQHPVSSQVSEKIEQAKNEQIQLYREIQGDIHKAMNMGFFLDAMKEDLEGFTPTSPSLNFFDYQANSEFFRNFQMALIGTSESSENPKLLDSADDPIIDVNGIS